MHSVRQSADQRSVMLYNFKKVLSDGKALQHLILIVQSQ